MTPHAQPNLITLTTITQSSSSHPQIMQQDKMATLITTQR